MDGKDIVYITKLIKELVQYLLQWGSDKCSFQDHVYIRERKSENVPFNNRNSWNRKQIRKLLFIMTIIDLEKFTNKDKLITYIEVFVKL